MTGGRDSRLWVAPGWTELASLGTTTSAEKLAGCGMSKTGPRLSLPAWENSGQGFWRFGTPGTLARDALVVAMRLPSISGKLSEPCITAEVSGNNASADEVYVIIRDRCGAVPDDDELAARSTF